MGAGGLSGRPPFARPKVVMVSKLETQAVSVRFDGISALDSVDLSLAEQDILGLLGPNGAGKTTLVNVMSGFQRPTQGRLLLDSDVVSGLRPEALALARCRANVSVGAGVSPLDSVGERRDRGIDSSSATGEGKKSRPGSPRLHRARRGRPSPGRCAPLCRRTSGRHCAGARDRTSFPVARRTGRRHGRGRMRRRWRGSYSNFRNKFGCGVLLIEHNIGIVMAVCRDLHVLNNGRTLATGPIEQVRRDPEVIAAYLGTA